MDTKVILTKDNFKITYYVFGTGDTNVCIFNAPGMSIKFWLPIINSMDNTRYKFIGCEYRGFPHNEDSLDNVENIYDSLVDDFKLILDNEKIEKSHAFSWCLGSKIMLNYHSRFPNLFISLNAISIVYEQSYGDNIVQGPFSKLIYKIKEQLDINPDSIKRIITLMKNIGEIPTNDFFSTINFEDDNGAALNMYDLLEEESTLSSLAFYLIDNPVGLQNYLKIYEKCSVEDESVSIQNLSIPLNLFKGDKDNIVTYDERDYKLFDKNKEFIKFFTIEGGSHFALVEYPIKFVKMFEMTL